MKVLVVGGGSGGHITPAMSVIRELLKKYPNTQVEFWTDRKYFKNILTTKIIFDNICLQNTINISYIKYLL